MLKKAINFALDSVVPGSSAIKVLLGTTKSPEKLEEYISLAIDVALDFLPGGKAFKFMKGFAAKVLKKKLGKQLVKEAEKMGSGVSKGIISLVKRDNKLAKLAEETFEGNSLLRKEANSLIHQLSIGNSNPGIGTKNIGKNIFEARSRGGARVYFRNGTDGIEVIGYSNKANQQQVIDQIFKIY